MTDKKISQLTSYTGASSIGTDLIPIVDVTANETKKITRSEFFKNVPYDIVTGTWNGNLISVTYGGLGANLSATGGSSQVLKQTTSGGSITVGQLAYADVSGLASMAQQSASSVAITGGTIDGTSVGATTKSTGDFTALTSTGTTSLGATSATSLDSTPIGATTPSTIKGTTGNFSGQVTIPDATADTSAVARGQLKRVLPVGNSSYASATTVTTTTPSLTAPANGWFIITSNAHAPAGNGATLSVSASLGTPSTIFSSGFFGAYGKSVSYIACTSGQSTTASVTATISSSGPILATALLEFVPNP